MCRKIFLPALVTAIHLMAVAAEPAKPPKRIFGETEAQRSERMAWWLHDRFGMFIHFGLYSVPARHEWVQSIEKVDAETYRKKYMPRFNPDLYDARKWAKTAKAAGARRSRRNSSGARRWTRARKSNAGASR